MLYNKFMKKFMITENDSGQRVDRFIQKTFYKMPQSLMYKEIRKKNIKVNKKRCSPEQILCAGDCLELYLKDDVLIEKEKHFDFEKASKRLDILYEDENLMLLNKKVGVLCHPDGNEYVDTLIASVKRYLREKGEWNPNEETFSPALANRIDRNTGGIVIAAKNSQTLRELGQLIKNKKIDKYYLAVVHGKPKKNKAVLKDWIIKDSKKNKVKVLHTEQDEAKQIITEYRVLDYYPDFSLIEVLLITGRTHQIRAHMASIGHPLHGDGKYGKDIGRYQQALYAYKIKFNTDENSHLSYLNKRTFEAKHITLLNNFKEKKYQ